MTLLYVCLFGSLGCLTRYLLERFTAGVLRIERPVATMAANAVGCAIAGWALYKIMPVGHSGIAQFVYPNTYLSSTSYDIIVTGFCGGLTTFSSAFAVPGLMWQSGRRNHALMYILGTPVVCCATFLLGVAIAH
jgi:CrcB protein